MAATYMIRKYLAGREAANRPENIARRATEIEAAQRAGLDRKSKFPEITPDNVEAASTYQNERIAYWRAALT